MNNKPIGCVENVCFGMPTLMGRRLTVYDIITKFFYENSIQEVLDDYEITLSDAKAAVEYCMNLECQRDTNRLHYCDGCILRTIEDKWEFKKDDYIQIDEKLTVSKDGSIVFLGEINELEEQSFGKPGWAIAGELAEVSGLGSAR